MRVIRDYVNSRLAEDVSRGALTLPLLDPTAELADFSVREKYRSWQSVMRFATLWTLYVGLAGTSAIIAVILCLR